MGLGLHGGGLECAKFLARCGAKLTVTDLRDAQSLQKPVDNLNSCVAECGAPPVNYVLGKHETEDFKKADIVIKNPGVRPDSEFLKFARRIETDISLFLRHNPARLTCVTGSKGKSFTASAIHYGLKVAHNNKLAGFNGNAYLGGNITVSPLTFLEKLTKDDDVVLELSSWQLGDLAAGSLKPHTALITAIMSDHLDRYGTMEAYVKDKRVIYQAQDSLCATIAGSDSWGKSFLAESRARCYTYTNGKLENGINGAYISPNGEGIAVGKIGVLNEGESAVVVPAYPSVPGLHQKTNLLAASLALLELNIPPDFIKNALGKFPGIEHRLEFFYEKNGIKFYNDTAATIPEAAACAVEALGHPVLVTGGTDKNLDFLPLCKAAKEAKAVILLSGSAEKKLVAALQEAKVSFLGPYSSLDAALCAVKETAHNGDAVVLSPGCASFGMFLNEFDRGRKWKEAVMRNWE
ncbi:MAG: UDP-N-acetylmuramoyl-L-alanine--D-glutamate ligase [Spirochaetaceae bacterium]|jgi:UDP-N-acetylmuramoylalanine--D-glutamate ligase|nr:UDP-N-acetylmuramoyl-L-alanine--D-glutamate ligase [Spirochaetaceae bacterium]